MIVPRLVFITCLFRNIKLSCSTKAQVKIIIRYDKKRGSERQSKTGNNKKTERIDIDERFFLI